MHEDLRYSIEVVTFSSTCFLFFFLKNSFGILHHRGGGSSGNIHTRTTTCVYDTHGVQSGTKLLLSNPHPSHTHARKVEAQPHECSGRAEPALQAESALNLRCASGLVHVNSLKKRFSSSFQLFRYISCVDN